MGSHWLVRATWYAALCMVVASVLVAFQQISGLGRVLVTNGSPESIHRDLFGSSSRDQPDFKAVFLLQAPVQLFSYSVILYMVGLAVHVFHPLVTGWGNDAKVRSSFLEVRDLEC
jgi:hypothetical protein